MFSLDERLHDLIEERDFFETMQVKTKSPKKTQQFGPLGMKCSINLCRYLFCIVRKNVIDVGEKFLVFGCALLLF